MRLISYNVLDGGEGRADPLAEVIEAQRADIVCIEEADNLGVIERIANRLKMDFIHAPGRKGAAALLSRWVISKTINHGLLTTDGPDKSFLEAEVIEPGGRAWAIGVLHLHHGARNDDETQREREMARVFGAFESRRAKHQPHLLIGDFNSNAPYQKIDPEACKPSTRKAWRENGNQIPRRVVQSLLDAGYVDTLRARDMTVAETRGTFSTQFPGQRVDFIFGFGLDASSINAAWIEQDRLAKYASDHFPIGVEII